MSVFVCGTNFAPRSRNEARVGNGDGDEKCGELAGKTNAGSNEMQCAKCISRDYTIEVINHVGWKLKTEKRKGYAHGQQCGQKRPSFFFWFSVSECGKKCCCQPPKNVCMLCDSAHISIKCNHVEMRGKCSPEMGAAGRWGDGSWKQRNGETETTY